MRIYFILFILLVCSCKKNHEVDVHISGSVNNLVTNQPISGIQLKLKRQPIRSNQYMSGNIVKIFETDVNGNFSITESLSDDYFYYLEISDDDYVLEPEEWGVVKKKNIDIYANNQNIELKTAAKAYLKMNFSDHTGSSNQDTLSIVHRMNNGNSYFQTYIYVTDTPTYSYEFTVDLMQGPQQTDFIFTKNGIDSTFTRFYGLSMGEIQVLNIDLH